MDRLLEAQTVVQATSSLRNGCVMRGDLVIRRYNLQPLLSVAAFRYCATADVWRVFSKAALRPWRSFLDAEST